MTTPEPARKLEGPGGTNLSAVIASLDSKSTLALLGYTCGLEVGSTTNSGTEIVGGNKVALTLCSCVGTLEWDAVLLILVATDSSRLPDPEVDQVLCRFELDSFPLDLGLVGV